MPRTSSCLLRLFLGVALLAAGVGLLLHFGGYILVRSDPIPEHSDVALMLVGGDSAVEARLNEAVRLQREGKVDHVMLSVGRAYFLGEWLPDLLRRHVIDIYGPDISHKVFLCEVSNEVDSTAEEAVQLRKCLVDQGWRSVVVVTSNYHTRRARIIWRKTLAKAQPPIDLTVAGVSDGDFEARGWWRKRRYAKTWFLEITKLIWTCLFESRGG